MHKVQSELLHAPCIKRAQCLDAHAVFAEVHEECFETVSIQRHCKSDATVVAASFVRATVAVVGVAVDTVAAVAQKSTYTKVLQYIN